MMEQNDEDFNYDSQYKKLCTGLGSFLNSAQQNQSLNSGVMTNDGCSSSSSTPYSSAELSKLCDTGVTLPNKPRTPQPKNRMYECKLCHVECNSEFMYQQHVQGSKHKKKVRNMARIEDLKAGGDGTGKASTMAASILESLRGDKSKRQKGNEVPTIESATINEICPTKSLREQLRESKEPVIALHYVIEIMPESEIGANGTAFDPLYTCELCCVTTQGIPMFAHLTGNKHRQTYLEMRFREYDLDKFGILKRSQEIQDKEGKRIDLIKTVRSDAKYTFPPGKEPVGKTNSSHDSENGHDIHDLKESQSSADDLFSRKSDEYNFFRSDNLDPSKQRLSHIAMLLEKLSTCAVKNEDDALLAHEVAQKLIKSLVDYKMKTVHPHHSKSVSESIISYMLESGCDNVLQALSVLYHIPTLSTPSSAIQDSLNNVSKTFELPSEENKPTQCQIVFRKRKCLDAKEKPKTSE